MKGHGMRDNAEDRKAQVRAMFDRLAADYDAAGPGCFAYFGRRLVEAVGIEPGQRVLDVASGRGAVLFPAAERVAETGDAVGIDLAGAMAQSTNAEAARRGLAARVRVMDAEHLTFPDAVFDHVLCGFGIMFFPHQDRALAGFLRVLKPGGRLGVSTWRVAPVDDLSAVLAGLGLAELAHTPGWITDPDHLAGLLTRAGFCDVHVAADTHVFRYDDVEQYWRNAYGTGLRQRLDALDAEQTERVRAALAERIRPLQRPDGISIAATALLAVARRPPD
jgi:SAM-dependent methyltransferase